MITGFLNIICSLHAYAKSDMLRPGDRRSEQDESLLAATAKNLRVIISGCRKQRAAEQPAYLSFGKVGFPVSGRTPRRA